MPTTDEIGDSLCIWLFDDDELVRPPTLERRVRAGIVAYDGLVEEERRWQRELAAGRGRYSAFKHGILLASLDHWLDRCPAVEARILKTERLGFAVEGAQELRERRRRAEAALREGP